MRNKIKRRHFLQASGAFFLGAPILSRLEKASAQKNLRASKKTVGNSFFEQEDLFVNGQNDYHTYRIPSMIVTKKGNLLAFCEGRRGGGGDAGDIDLLVKRSTDNGKTWSSQQIVWNDGANTCGNPCPVVDQKTGTIHLLMTHNLGQDRESQIIDSTSQGTRTVWISRSSDDGKTWTKPVEITNTTKQKDWTWYATGPGTGIQLASNRLVVPCDHIESNSKRYFSHVIYSDDNGKTWQLGGSTPQSEVNECEVVELADERLLLNMRSYNREQKARAVSLSSDRGLTWSNISRDEELIEPICQASIRRYSLAKNTGKNRVLFSNPASEKREKMTIKLSYDECESWAVSKLINAGLSAYSCLAVLPDKTIACFYERGERSPYERLTLARFNLAWLTDGKDF